MLAVIVIQYNLRCIEIIAMFRKDNGNGMINNNIKCIEMDIADSAVNDFNEINNNI